MTLCVELQQLNGKAESEPHDPSLRRTCKDPVRERESRLGVSSLWNSLM